MAIGDYQLSIRTYVADNIINECLGPPPSSLPELKYYVPAFNPTVLIYDGDDLLGVTAPVATTNTIENQLDYDDNGTPTPFVGNLKPGHVTRMPFDGVNPPRLKIRITKDIDKDNIGGQANVFYICDDQMRVWVVIHVSPHVFAEGQKWEIVTDLVVADATQISNFVEDPRLFEYKTASELLLPEIIVGSSEDIGRGKASYTMAQFIDPALTISDQRIMMLQSADPIAANSIRAVNNIDFGFDSPKSSLDLNSNTLEISGNDITGRMKVVNALDNSLIFSGNNINLVLQSDNINCLNMTGTNWIVCHNEKITSSNAAVKPEELVRKQELDNESATRSSEVSLLQANIDNEAAIRADANANLDQKIEAAIKGLDPQESIIDEINFVTSEPVIRNNGDRYINTEPGISNITTITVAANNIYQWDTDHWIEIAPDKGTFVFNETSERAKIYNGLSWVYFASFLKHNSLAGINEGDHRHISETRSISIEFLDQPDVVVLTQAQINNYSNDAKYVFYDFTNKTFKQRDNSQRTLVNGDYIKIFQIETLINDLEFSDSYERGKIEIDRHHEIALGDRGTGEPYNIIISGNRIIAEFQTDKDFRNLKNLTVEQQRVIKNRGSRNKITLNDDQIFSANPHYVGFDFKHPNPYYLPLMFNWYPGYPDASNYGKCLFRDYWEAQGGDYINQISPRINPRTATATTWTQFTLHDIAGRFFRAGSFNGTSEDLDLYTRESQANIGSITIPTTQYSNETGNHIRILNDSFKHILSHGARVYDTNSSLPGPGTIPQKTTVIGPGTVVNGANDVSIYLIDAETGDDADEVPSGDLIIDGGGNCGLSIQGDIFQGHWHAPVQLNFTYNSATTTVNHVTGNDGAGAYGRNIVNSYAKDVVPDGVNGEPRIGQETRGTNMLIYYYLLS